MSHVMCLVSHRTCHVTQGYSLEGLLSTGPTPSNSFSSWHWVRFSPPQKTLNLISVRHLCIWKHKHCVRTHSTLSIHDIYGLMHCFTLFHFFLTWLSVKELPRLVLPLTGQNWYHCNLPLNITSAVQSNKNL